MSPFSLFIGWELVSWASFLIKIQTPVEDHRFSDYIQLPDLGDNPDDQTVLQYAMGREDAAMKQYRELSNSTAPGPGAGLHKGGGDHLTILRFGE